MIDLEQSNNANINPERIELLDAIRGFALLGILLMNLEAFTGPLSGAMTGINMQWHGMNRWADAFIYIFVQGKFWTLFTLLFGISFALMHERARLRRADFTSIFHRRLLALSAIGFIHYVFIWEGDILFSYTLGGFILLWFLNTAKPISWLSIVAWFIAPMLLIALLGYYSSGTHDSEAFARELAQQTRIQGHSAYSEVLHWRMNQFIESFADLIIFIPMTIAMFLLGIRFYRTGKVTPLIKIEKMDILLPLFLTSAGAFLMLISIGIAPSLDITHLDKHFAQVMILNFLAGVLMCLGYFFGLRLLWASPACRNKLRIFEPLGRMALTNYLMQSIICTFIFYGYGLGFFDQLTRFWHIPFALGLIALQAVFSNFWLKRFSMGPAEYVWRWLTYSKRPKFVL